MVYYHHSDRSSPQRRTTTGMRSPRPGRVTRLAPVNATTADPAEAVGTTCRPRWRPRQLVELLTRRAGQSIRPTGVLSSRWPMFLPAAAVPLSCRWNHSPPPVRYLFIGPKGNPPTNRRRSGSPLPIFPVNFIARRADSTLCRRRTQAIPEAGWDHDAKQNVAPPTPEIVSVGPAPIPPQSIIADTPANYLAGFTMVAMATTLVGSVAAGFPRETQRAATTNCRTFRSHTTTRSRMATPVPSTRPSAASCRRDHSCTPGVRTDRGALTLDRDNPSVVVSSALTHQVEEVMRHLYGELPYESCQSNNRLEPSPILSFGE